MKVIFCAGARVGQSDDSMVTDWRSDDESLHDLRKRALLWSAGLWPESDGEYEAAVWITDCDGDVLAVEEVTVAADGELEF